MERKQEPPSPKMKSASAVLLRTDFTFSPATNRLAADKSKTNPFYELALP
jgi:hypothetical protein